MDKELNVYLLLLSYCAKTGNEFCLGFFNCNNCCYSLGDLGARKFMKVKDEDIYVGIPAALLPDIVENLGKLGSA